MFNATPALPGSVTPTPVALASVVATGHVAGMMPVSAVAPVIHNEAIDFNLRQQPNSKQPIRAEKEKDAESEAVPALPGYVIPFGFAPFFAQMFAQGQVSGTDVDAMFKQALQNNGPKNFSIGSESFLDPLQDQLLYNAPPYEEGESSAIPAMPAPAASGEARYLYSADYAYGAYRTSMNPEA
ncbi:hypothetical protein GC177_03220 [bacterium]|nr:hypothetical protein [bacterium]